MQREILRLNAVARVARDDQTRQHAFAKTQFEEHISLRVQDCTLICGPFLVATRGMEAIGPRDMAAEHSMFEPPKHLLKNCHLPLDEDPDTAVGLSVNDSIAFGSVE